MKKQSNTLFLLVLGFILSLNSYAQKPFTENYNWLHGEWKNAVYGDIVDIYSDGNIRFLKNGLVFSEEEEENWMWDYPKPETIDDLKANILFRDKYPCEIGKWHETSLNADIEALLFDYETGNYPFEPIHTYLGIDHENKKLFYYSENGVKIILTKTSALTFEEQIQTELREKEENLHKALNGNKFAWLHGQWDWDFIDYRIVNIDKDSVRIDLGDKDGPTGHFKVSRTEKGPLDLHYKVNDFTQEVELVIDINSFDIYVDEISQNLYAYYDFDQAIGFQKVSDYTQDEQKTLEYKEKEKQNPIHEIVDEEIYTIVEEMPDFSGGSAKLVEYLANNVKYPQKAKESGIQGRVFVGFVVEPDGSLSNIKVARSLGGGCDEEAVRVVKNMPKWKPGKQRGKAVRVSYLLSISFK